MIGRIQKEESTIANKQWHGYVEINGVISARTLRRKENRRTWIFPEIANDIFNRRLQQANYHRQDGGKEQLDQVFGSRLPPSDRAKLYAPNANARVKSLRLEKDAPKSWKDFIEGLAERDPLSAKFGSAWVRQKGKHKREIMHSPPIRGQYPWDDKEYWKKERTEQALMQIASASRQQFIWSGKEDVLGLSGGNILIFLSICQHIWDAWLRDTRGDEGLHDATLPSIAPEIQSQGIREASEEWMSKQREGGDSIRRSRFFRVIGKYFYTRLTDDVAMSYPGLNGFSLNLGSLRSASDVSDFLKKCVEYGDLYDAPHTSKSKGEKRLKYYLAPILCPYFKIPFRHTKEPDYVEPETIREWISDKYEKSKPEVIMQSQNDLFGSENPD